MADFVIKQGDLLPEIVAICKDGAGDPVDLTLAVSVEFHMKKDGAGATKVNAAAAFVDKPSGSVKYSWVVGDTDTPDIYDAEFEVMWPGSKPETYPNGSPNISVEVTEELA